MSQERTTETSGRISDANHKSDRGNTRGTSRVLPVLGNPASVGRSSLGYSAKEPLLLDFDKGAHRAANRRDTLVIDSWSDVDEWMKDKASLESYSTIVVDTVGRCLDVLSANIIDRNPKYGRDGNLTQQGWGVLKGGFRTW